MKKWTAVWVIPLISSSYVSGIDWGSGLSPRGMYGSVEYGYTQEEAVDKYNTSSRNSFLQNYTLGKRGSIYSPNLMSYMVQGSLFVNDTGSKTNDITTDSSTKSINYRVNTDFIRGTKYPFSVFADQTTSPYSSVQPGSSLSYNQTTGRYGFSGSAELPYFNLRYSAETSDMKRDESFADETRNNKEYMVSIYKNFNSGTFSTVYTDTARDYFRNDRSFNSQQSWSDHSRNARMNGTWNVDKTLRITSALSYLDNSYLNMTNITGSANVNWRPSDRYTAGLDLSANSLKGAGSGTDSLILGGNSFYQVTPEFSTTQNVSLYRITGNSMVQTMETVTVGGNYVKSLEDTLVLSAGVNGMFKGEQNSAASDMNRTMPDRNTYSYTLTGGASKMVESIRSRVSANLSYYDSISSTDENTKRISVNTMLNTTLQENLTYSLSGYFIKEESQYLQTLTALDGNMTQRDTQVVTLDNALRYWQDIGLNGKVSLGGGVSYSASQYNQSQKVTRVFPHVDGSFSYRFFNSMFLNSTLSASQDSVNDLTNYSAYLGLNYTLRRVMMSFGTRYFTQTGGIIGKREQSSAFFKISRTF